MKVIARFSSGKLIELEVEANYSVQSLKQKIEEKTGIVPSLQAIMFKGKGMEDGKSLADYNVREESICLVITRTPKQPEGQVRPELH